MREQRPRRRTGTFGPGGLIVAATMLALGLAACGGDDDGGGNNTPPPGNTVATSSAVAIRLTDNAFEPKAFAVKAGEEVTITIKNDGKAVHNMHILSRDKEGKDFSSAATVNPGKEDVFKITLTKTGTVNFQCDYHVPDMVGKITVVQ